MVIDPRRDALPAQLRADVVVVGAGPAGITLALELGRAGADVLVLESGSTDVGDADVSDLNEVESELPPPYDLVRSRARVLGGTTAYWTGHCHPLEPSAFSARAWVAGSGWPIGPADLADGYAAAQDLVEIGQEAFDLAAWNGALRQAGVPVVDGPVVTTSLARVSPPTRFGERYRGELEASSTVRVVLRTTAIEVRVDGPAPGVSELRVRTPVGALTSVKGSLYVLAMGGLETPRLLLASGIGNEHDLVGRYFMEHPHVQLGTGVFTSRFETGVAALAYGIPFAVQGRQLLLSLVLRDDVVTQERLLSASFALVGTAEEGGGPRAPAVAALAADVGDVDVGAARGIFLRGEQRPHRDNRVMLSPTAVDAHGLPRLRLSWRFRDEDLADHIRSYRILARELSVAGYGRLGLRSEQGHTPFISGGHHHMGTTRMSDDPRSGVVDPNLRVHGQPNLYVASSAVFPTCGSENPTLTIVALAVRLARHLAAVA